MEICVTMFLDVRWAYSGISHDSRCTAGFKGSGQIPIACIVLSMGAAELMPYFMCDIIDVKWIVDRASGTSPSPSFSIFVTNDSISSQSAAACTKNMSYVIIFCTNFSITFNLILVYLHVNIVIVVWIGYWVKMD